MTLAGRSETEADVVKTGALITDGLVNNVLKATIADGTEVVFRMHPRGVKNGYFWVESTAALKAAEAGALSYKTYIIDDTRETFDFDYMIMEALPGETMRNFTKSGEIEYEYEEQLIRETGRNVGLIHTVLPKGFGFFLNNVAKEQAELLGQYSTFSEHIYSALDDDLNYLYDDEQITIEQRQKIASLFDNHARLLECNNPTLIHNDIADWNTLSDGKHVTGIIDWDECISGDPVMEFSAYSLFFSEPRMSWFKEGYQEVNELPELFEEKFQLFKLRYLVSKLKLRVVMSKVHDSPGLQRNIRRGFEAMKEVFEYFGV
jgi:aminoglycoside phosphotransferase (APT) family kinase protein